MSPTHAPAKRGGGHGLAAVQRTLRTIECLADTEQGLSVTEIGQRLKVNKSIAFRILSALMDAGYVYQNEVTLRYHLTYKISNLGLRQLATARLIDQCGPILRTLAEETGELVRLAVIEADQVIWVHASSGRQRRLVIDPIYSHEIIYHVHAAGKAWLFTLPAEKVERLVGTSKLGQETSKSISSLKALMEDLQKSRKRGFAMNYEESDLGVGAVAAPIMVTGLGRDSICVGVVSLAAPTSRMNREALIAAAPQVIEATRRLADVWPLKPESMRPRTADEVARM